MTSERYTTGLDMLQRVDGKGGDAVVKSLQAIAPDFARYLIEFPFGDIYARPGLDLRSREIATIAALTALGNAAPQLKVHIAAGLNVGLTQEEIKEGLEALRSNRTASQVAAKKAPKVAKKANLVEIDTKLFTDMDLD